MCVSRKLSEITEVRESSRQFSTSELSDLWATERRSWKKQCKRKTREFKKAKVLYHTPDCSLAFESDSPLVSVRAESEAV